jgi:hypothetical protein
MAACHQNHLPQKNTCSFCDLPINEFVVPKLIANKAIYHKFVVYENHVPQTQFDMPQKFKPHVPKIPIHVLKYFKILAAIY